MKNFKIWCETNEIRDKVLEKMETDGIVWCGTREKPTKWQEVFEAPMSLFVENAILTQGHNRVFFNHHRYNEILPINYIGITKANLELTDIVKYRDGTLGIVLRNSLSKDGLGIFSRDHDMCVGYLSNFNKDLTYADKEMRHRDIMAIYKTKTSPRQYSALTDFFDKKFNEEWTWERQEPEPKELTMTELEKILGYPVKIVKD